MSDTRQQKPEAGGCFSVGARVVTQVATLGEKERVLHPRGSVAIVVKVLNDGEETAYRIRFPDGLEEVFGAAEVTSLVAHQERAIGKRQGDLQWTVLQRTASSIDFHSHPLFQRVLFRCVIGSRAYGLADAESDVDRRGFYLAPADHHWSLYGVPDQIECDETQEAYWEVQKFLVLALKANPNVLECLYSPIVEASTPLGEELIAMRSAFLSRLVYQTYNGYVMSQFKKMQADIRNQGQVKWKHVMHLIRLLISGISVLREGFVPVRVDDHREELLTIKRGEMPWEETEKWRLGLHADFDKALAETKLPERPDYEMANEFLIKARRAAIAEDLP